MLIKKKEKKKVILFSDFAQNDKKIFQAFFS